MVCWSCYGSGTRFGLTEACLVCKGTGYPPGYTPPTVEEVRLWLREQAADEMVRANQQMGLYADMKVLEWPKL